MSTINSFIDLWIWSKWNYHWVTVLRCILRKYISSNYNCNIILQTQYCVTVRLVPVKLYVWICINHIVNAFCTTNCAECGARVCVRVREWEDLICTSWNINQANQQNKHNSQSKQSMKKGLFNDNEYAISGILIAWRLWSHFMATTLSWAHIGVFAFLIDINWFRLCN